LALFFTATMMRSQLVTQTFSYNGGYQVFVVPPCVTTVSVDLRGASGANPFDKVSNTSYGFGGRLRGLLSVVPGQTLIVFVGGQGGSSGSGGFNGGGSGGNTGNTDGSCPTGPAAGGGGASDIRMGGNALTDRVAVAGGGGGAGRDYCLGTCQPCGCGGSGGNGGGFSSLFSNGGTAYDCGYSYAGSGTNNGLGASTSGAGGGGTGDSGGANGSAGSFGAGGSGASGYYDVAGGGGGGGYYGGGGGGAASSGNGVGGGGGGGGSSFAHATYVTGAITNVGFQNGNGLVIISYNLAGSPVTAQASPSSKCFGAATVTLSAQNGLTYSWSHGPTGFSTTVSPTVTTIYTVSAISVLGCSSTATVMVEVISPTLTTAVSTPTVCSGASVSLAASSPGNTFNWYTVPTGGSSFSTSAHLASVVVTPTAGTIYYAEAVTSGTIATVTFTPSGSVQTFTVPQYVTKIDIDARGAGGGSVSVSCTANGGLGARMRASFNVVSGQVLSVIAGQSGQTNNEDGGGGGGSFVGIGATPLIVAGGGGGASNNIQLCGSNLNGVNASITTFATASADGAVPGGYPGNGGFANTGVGGGGGGYYTDGVAGSSGPSGNGKSFINGGAGGTGSGGDSGGHGGGGAGWYTGGNGGGGGGFAGGGTNAVFASYTGGGGGSSFNGGFNQVNTAGFQAGDGVVIISYTVPSGCISASRTAVAFTAVPLPTLTAISTSSAICVGGTVAVSATGANTYTWAGGQVNGVAFTPAGSASYAVSGTSSVGCVSGAPATVSVTVNPLPVFSVSTPTSICLNKSATLTATGTNIFTWSTGPTATSIVVSPTTTTTYTVLGTNTLTGCSNTAATNVTVIPLPNITASSGSICSGQTYTIAVSGGTSYVYTGGSQFVNPTTNTNYTVTGTAATGCTNNAFSTVTVAPRPTVTVSSGSICAGQSYSIITSGAVTYTINGGSFLVSPVTSTNYLVTGSSSLGCASTNTATATITVHARPAISALNGSICVGSSFLINPTGASTYTITGGSFAVSPATTTAYSVTGTSSVGCLSSNTAVVTVSVHPIPFITTNSGSICIGNSFTVIPGGASSYTITGSNFTVSPTSNASYSVTGTSSAGCVGNNTAVATVNVFSGPVIAAAGGTICAGQLFNIVPSGGTSFSITGNIFNVSPSSTNSYSVTGTGANGCLSTNTVVVTVSVFALPFVAVPSGTICVGDQFVLAPGGASTYSVTGNNFTVSPSTTTSYSVTGTSTAGCLSSNTAVATVTVHALPVLSVNSGSICLGKTFTVMPAGASTYTITGGNFQVSPPSTTSYSVTGSSSVGCLSSNTAVSSVTVESLPVVTAPGGEICYLQSFSIVPSGALSYSVTGNTFSVTPAQTTNYTVSGADAKGCVGQAVVTVTVNQLPLVSANASTVAICIGQQVTLSGSGAQTYTWTSPVLNGQAFSPSVTANYQVSGTSSAGCTGTNQAQITITVNPLPLVSINAATTAVCRGKQLTMSAGGASYYQWSPVIANGIPFTPTSSATYSVTGVDNNGCASGATIGLSVYPVPVITISSSSLTSCKGETVSLALSGASTYVWSDSSTSSTNVIFPFVSTVYSYTGTSAEGCVASGSYSQEIVECHPSIKVSTTIKQITCGLKRDGRITTQTDVSYPLHKILYLWEPADLCPDNNCAILDSLNPGAYSLLMLVTYTVNTNYSSTDTLDVLTFDILTPANGCELEIYSGISPNGDGVNDRWYIGSIEEFPENQVWIYNRWGSKLFETKGYDNITRYWPVNGESIPSGTYFYIIDPGNGKAPIKGWIELMH
jgi:gliding motility-associated-like protein